MSARAAQAIGLLLLPLLLFAAIEALNDLRSARAERAIARVAAVPKPLIAADEIAIPAKDAGTAQRALVQTLGDRASAAAVRLATASIGAAPAGHSVASEIVAVGEEAAMAHFVAALEGGRPLVRLDRWTLSPTGEGLRLSGHAVAFWQAQAPPSTATRAPPDIAAPSGPTALPPGLFADEATARQGNGFPAELIGIVGRIAIDPQAMLKLSNGSTRTVAIGETVADWTLVQIGADRVHFRKGGEERQLVLPTAAP